MAPMRISLLITGVVLVLASCFAVSQTLQIQAIPSQGAIVGETYTLPMAVIGGAAPYTFQLVTGDLPPGWH